MIHQSPSYKYIHVTHTQEDFKWLWNPLRIFYSSLEAYRQATEEINWFNFSFYNIWIYHIITTTVALNTFNKNKKSISTLLENIFTTDIAGLITVSYCPRLMTKKWQTKDHSLVRHTEPKLKGSKLWPKSSQKTRKN